MDWVTVGVSDIKKLYSQREELYLHNCHFGGSVSNKHTETRVANILLSKSVLILEFTIRSWCVGYHDTPEVSEKLVSWAARLKVEFEVGLNQLDWLSCRKPQTHLRSKFLVLLMRTKSHWTLNPHIHLGLEELEPSTKRMKALFQLGYRINLLK